MTGTLRPAFESLAQAEQVIDWDWYYEPHMLVDNDRKKAGIVAMKTALIDNKFGENIDLTIGAWGTAVTRRTKEFQAAEGLKVDGIVGPTTARHLFRVYDFATEAKYRIPNHLVGRQCTWESGNDPVARSQTGDEGRAQINPPSHPLVTEQQMWTPSFASNFVGSYQHGSFIYVGGDWDGAVAAYNVGASLAKQWVQAGKPATGGPVLYTKADGTPVYAWQHCTEYCSHVKSAYH